MSKKLLTLIGGSALAAMLLVGCNTNKIQNPPPEDVNKGVVNDNNVDLNKNNDLNNTHYPKSEDINTPTDKDPTKDRNTPREEIIEDDIDRKDADNKDE